MFKRKPAELSKSGATQNHCCGARRRQESELVAYHDQRGLLGQPTTFYVGIGFGIVFQVAIATILFCLFVAA